MSAAPKSEIRVGVITEPASSHLNLYLGSLAKCQGVAAVALADPTGSIKSVHKSFRDCSEMIREFNPHLLIVTLEAHHMPTALRVAIESGRPVLSEKHPCVRAADFEPLAEEAQRRKQSLILAFASRFSPLVQKARDLVRSGTIGKVYSATIDIVSDQPRMWRQDYLASWRSKRSTAGGGHLVTTGIHHIDLCAYIMGQTIRRVHGFSRNVGGSPSEVDDANAIILETSGGAVATLQSGCYRDRGYESRIMLWGSSGWVRLSVQPSAPMEWYSSASGRVERFEDTTGYFDHEYLPLVQSAVNTARGIELPAVTVAEGLNVVRTLFGVYEAAKTGRVQQIG